MPDKYCISSTVELLEKIKHVSATGLVASLDVTSLFTNVPVKRNIEINTNCAYNNKNIAPLPIAKKILRELLLKCTTETLFRHPNGDLYKQRDGVAMRSQLGTFFANYYMTHLKSKVLKTFDPTSATILYLRYVDDILLVVPKIQTLHSLKDKFEAKSVPILR